MADQKKLDITSEAMATTYEEGITDIVQTLLDSREGLTDEEFGSTILALDMKTIVAN